MLTDTTIRRLKPSDKCTPNRPDKHSDGNGLQLWVRHTGAKKWIVAYRQHGKQTNITLGDYPTISLSQARLHALEIKEKLKQGIDPKTAKPNAVLFGEMASEYHAQRDPNNPANKGKHTVAPTTHKRDFAQYQNDIAPHLAHIDINAITPQMVLDVAKRIEQRGAYDMAKRAIRQMGLSDTWVFFNPKSKKSISENILTSALRRLGYKGSMTGHGFRGIASTKLHELQYDHQAIETQLAHSKADKVSLAYNGAMYLDYRIQMMTEWANLIDDERAKFAKNPPPTIFP